MRAQSSLLVLAVACSALLAGCAQVSSPKPEAAAVVDDEAFCQTKGAPGSNAFAACLKDRDVARSQHETRMDRTHQRVVDDMMKPR